ncbi:DNA repair protein Rad50, partial [Elizabethkingia miricola]|nr:DNA repair protein Rad50 [Elizabethkingia miricola]
NISDSEELNTQIIEELKENYNFANNAYHVEYKLIIRQYLKNNVSRFENTGDFQSLCEEILPPEILNDINILEKEVIEKIGKYLKDINLKNKRLNNRKLQKLAAIVEEVSNEVSEQRNNIRLINNFLNSDDKEITGGHLVSIEDSNQDSFSSGWMDTFTDNITKDFELGLNDSLFESEKGISNDLERFPSLKEKLLQAFYRSGGSRNLKPKIEELLNPKSYYNVKFSIKTSQGKKNDGSTSQAYAAISLLCIAKLSLLNKQSKNKFVEAIRFMAIDEAEGLGSNFDMLYNIARANDYQLLSLSINPNKIDIEGQNIYLLHNSKEDEKVNYTPIPIFGSMN